MRLYVISDGAFATHALPASGVVTVGSAPECEVRVVDPSVAPHHLRLHLGLQVRIERQVVRGQRHVRPEERLEPSLAPLVERIPSGVQVDTVPSMDAPDDLRRRQNSKIHKFEKLSTG